MPNCNDGQWLCPWSDMVDILQGEAIVQIANAQDDHQNTTANLTLIATAHVNALD